MKNIFLFAGEKSGDLHGAGLLRNLKTQFPHHIFTGVAGPEMREEGMHCFMQMEEFQVMGLTDVLLSFFKLRRQFYQILEYILRTNPTIVILIDYPGFNLRLAKHLRKKGYKGKIIQYIAPTIWAWGKNRKNTLIENYDLLLTIYPFEEKLFDGTSLKVKYVGNPVKEAIIDHPYDENWAGLCGVKEKSNLVALFPGSRKSEISNHLPYQLQVAEILKKENPSLSFALSCADDKMMGPMHGMIKKTGLKMDKDLFFIPKTYSYELMRDCRTAIAKSGSVTLELALHKRPTVVMYKLTPLNRFFAKYIIRLKLAHYCIVNILSGRTVFPELIEKGLSLEQLAESFQSLNNDGSKREECIAGCNELPYILKDGTASLEAVKAIRELV